MSFVTRIMPDNPVLTKELRVRMRGARAYWILFGYLGFLALVTLGLYWGWTANAQTEGGEAEVARLGEQLFYYIMATQVFLVLFITPAITSGALTIENEQRTMDMLTMTRLPRRSIIVGKLLAAVSFTSLLLISSLPLISICFMLGSIDPAMVFSYYMMLLMGSFAVGAMGLMWSSIARATTQAVIFTYASLFIVFVGGAILFSIATAAGLAGFMSGSSTLGLTVLVALGLVWFGERFLGLGGVNGIGFAVTCLLSGILFAAIAMVRLETWPERKALLLRFLTLLFVGVELLALDFWWLDAWYNRGSQIIQLVVQPPIAALVLTALLLMFLVPTFATGDLLPMEARRFGRYLAGGWTPKGLSRGKMASGLPFLVLLTAFSLGLYALSFVFVGKANQFAKSSASVVQAPSPMPPSSPSGTVLSTTTNQYGQTVTTTMVNGRIVTRTVGPAGQSAPPKNAPKPAPAGDFPQAALTLLASVVGFALFCMFLSVAFRNRWVAWIVAYLCLLVMLIAPEISHIPAYSGDAPQVGVQLYYLNPMQSIIQMSDPSNYYNRPLMEKGYMLWGQRPMWQAITYTWLLIGGLSFLLLLFLVRREKRRAAAVPYEEMAAA